MPFVKLDCAMLDSSLWPDKDSRDVFITMLLMADLWDTEEPIDAIRVRSLESAGWSVPPGWYGWVAAAGPGIIHRCGIDDMDRGIKALERLSSPDPDSRSPRFEGRRIARVAGGYVILNYDEYRKRDYTAAERARRYREKMLASRRNVTASNDSAAGVTDERRDITHAESREQSSESECADNRDAAHLSAAPPQRTPAKRKPKSEQPLIPDATPEAPSRKPDPIWNAVADRWFGGKVIKSQATRVGKIVRDLRALVTDPERAAEEIAVRVAHMTEAWGGGTETPESVVKHWHKFAQPTTPKVPDAEIRKRQADAEFQQNLMASVSRIAALPEAQQEPLYLTNQ